MISSNSEVLKVAQALSNQPFDTTHLMERVSREKRNKIRRDRSKLIPSMTGLLMEDHVRTIINSHGYSPFPDISGSRYRFQNKGPAHQRSVTVYDKDQKRTYIELDYLTLIGGLPTAFEVKTASNVREAVDIERIARLAACLVDIGHDQFGYVVIAPLDTIMKNADHIAGLKQLGGITVPVPHNLDDLHEEVAAILYTAYQTNHISKEARIY